MAKDPAGDGFDALIKTLSDYKRKEKIADAAVSWRRAMLSGRFDEAGEGLVTLLMIIDDYTGRTPEPNEDPHTVGDTVPGLD